MSKKVFWLTLTVAMTGLIWLPYILDCMMAGGIMGGQPLAQRCAASCLGATDDGIA
jgi:hypothetical protein